MYGNLVTAAAGFLLASRWHINVGLLAAVLAGLGLVIASACVFNNVLDRALDARMARTKRRALVTGQISPRAALVYATVLGLVGIALLATHTGPLATTLAAAGLFGYVVLYGAAKRHSAAGTLVGSLPGATPPLVGYTAVTHHFDITAALLFLTLVIWQMPHFYAIALYRLKDYTDAGLPVLPAKRGTVLTKRRILAWIVAFMAVAPLLAIFGYTNALYLVIMPLLGLAWLTLGIKNLRTTTGDAAWGRLMFRFSLIVITVWSILVAITVRPV